MSQEKYDDEFILGMNLDRTEKMRRNYRKCWKQKRFHLIEITVYWQKEEKIEASKRTGKNTIVEMSGFKFQYH